MKYSELKIETLRQMPARLRPGAALLVRAGYMKDGLTSLGEALYSRLRYGSQAHPAGEFLAQIGLPSIRTEDGKIYSPSSGGRADILQCDACGYAAERENARFKKPSVGDEKPEPLEKVRTPECSTIEALAQFLGVPKARTAKALMYTRIHDGKFIFVVLRGDMQVSERKLEKNIDRVRMATEDEIIAAGAVPGYASPIGLKNALIVVDDAIPPSANLVAGANEPGYHLKNTNYGRDYMAGTVADLALAEPGAACPECGQTMSLHPAELVCLEDGEWILDNLLEPLAETQHDERGLTLPAAAAPFAVYLLHLTGKDLDTRGQAEQLHDQWEATGVSVLYDDRDERAGVKFADADLIGCPIRVTVGERGLKDGMVELKERTQNESMPVPIGQALRTIQSLMKKAP